MAFPYVKIIVIILFITYIRLLESQLFPFNPILILKIIDGQTDKITKPLNENIYKCVL